MINSFQGYGVDVPILVENDSQFQVDAPKWFAVRPENANCRAGGSRRGSSVRCFLLGGGPVGRLPG
jgi:hypothetical protein